MNSPANINFTKSDLTDQFGEHRVGGSLTKEANVKRTSDAKNSEHTYVPIRGYRHAMTQAIGMLRTQFIHDTRKDEVDEQKFKSEHRKL